jgi:aminoglycoside 6'-N-acetyltransferase
VKEKFLPRIRREAPTFQHVAELDGRPFAKLQCYRNIDYPDYAAEIGVNDGISIDLFIGEPEFLGRGLGKKMLRQYLMDVAFPLHPGERRCFICHEAENAAALACSRSAGFEFLRDVMEAGLPCRLLVFSK